MTTSSDPKTWVAQYGDALFRYAMLRLNNTSVAEDIVQETFLAALKSRGSFAGQSSEKTWLIGILKHKIIDHFRKTGSEYTVEDITTVSDQSDNVFDEKGHWKIALSEWKNPDHSLEQEQFWEIFNRCISHLPHHLADLFILKEFRDVNSEDICKVLGISNTNNMWVMLSRARMRLRDCLETHWFGSER